MSRSGFTDTVWSSNYIPRVTHKMRIESRRLAEERQESLKALAAYDRRVKHEDGQYASTR